MPTFSEAFDLNKNQAELDFVNIPLDTDILLFIDPFAISQRVDPFSRRCHMTILAYFQKVVDLIRSGNESRAKSLLLYLREPNETRLGLSSGRPQGAGIGTQQAEQLFQAVRDSTAVRTGFLTHLEECELMIPGIGWDKLSDLTTNIIRIHLAEYTQEQCFLHNLPVTSAPLRPCFDLDSLNWVSQYLNLPIWGRSPILLVPKAFVRYTPAYNHQKYYNRFVLEYLQTEALSAGSSLVRALKNGRRVVYKKDLRSRYPCTKDFLYTFSRDHPQVLEEYREALERLEKTDRQSDVGPEDESEIAGMLAMVLRSIPRGGENASRYHSFMAGAVEFLFFPKLLHPIKEREIHQGRKRIDILMDNGAREGIFHRLHDVFKIPCSYIPFECKNYLTEVANPELDQLSGRFSVNRGKVGFLCCRNFESRGLFVKRCRDTFIDDRGLILPLDDQKILQCLELIEGGRRHAVDDLIADIVREICAS